MNRFYRKIYFNIFLTLVFLFGFIGFAILSLDKIVDEKNELVSVHAVELILAQKLHSEISMQFAAMPIYVLSGDESVLTSFDNNRKDFARILATLKSKDNDKGEQKLLDEISIAEKAMHESGVKAIGMIRGGASPKVVHDYFRKLRPEDRKNLPSLLQTLVDTKMREFEGAKKEDARISKRVLIFLSLASIVCIIFAGVISSLIIKIIKNKKRSEEKEAYISNARKEIIDTVSHDLKNPLSSIKLGLQYLEKKISRNENYTDIDVTKGLTIIFRSVDKMEKMISDLLDHTKLEAGKMVLDPTECNLATFTNEIIEQFRPIALSRKIRLTSDLIEDGTTVYCDQVRIEQVLSNIIGNALKFTPEGGEIHVLMSFKKDDVIISIHDSGYGMSKDQLNHVFDRYWQVKETSKQGTGLGLAIAKIVIETHHGRIWAESEPGKGSSFHFSLPLDPDHSRVLH